MEVVTIEVLLKISYTSGYDLESFFCFAKKEIIKIGTELLRESENCKGGLPNKKSR